MAAQAVNAWHEIPLLTTRASAVIDFQLYRPRLISMIRAFNIGLLVIALLGLMGHSTATAAAPMAAGSLHASNSAMDCIDVAPAPEKSPCKKMTLHCMAAMGCAWFAVIEPLERIAPRVAADRVESASVLATRLAGRSFGPEPDPPSLLI